MLGDYRIWGFPSLTSLQIPEKLPESWAEKVYLQGACTFKDGGAPKERRRRRAETWLSKRVFLECPFLLCPLKVFRTLQLFLRTNLKGAEKKRTLQKHPFGQPKLRTTPSPLLWRTLKRSDPEKKTRALLSPGREPKTIYHLRPRGKSSSGSPRLR